MDIKNLKPKTKESAFLISLDGKAVFGFGNIDCMRLIKTDIVYNGNPCKLIDWKKRYSGLAFVEVDCILENEKHNQWDFNGYKINGFAWQIDFIKCFTDDIQIIPADLIPVIKDIGMYCHTDPNRYFMQGIFFSENGDIVATDSKRLSLKTSPIKFHNSIIIPEAFAPFSKKDITVKYGSVTREFYGIAETYNYIWLSDGDNLVVTQCIKGNFPNYKKIVPEFDTMEKIFCKGFSTFKKQEKVYKSHTMKVYIRDTSLIKPADDDSPELCFGKLEGFNVDTVFNGDYLKGLYKQFGDEIYAYIPEDKNRCFGFGNKDYFTVIMPMIA